MRIYNNVNKNFKRKKKQSQKENKNKNKNEVPWLQYGILGVDSETGEQLWENW